MFVEDGGSNIVPKPAALVRELLGFWGDDFGKRVEGAEVNQEALLLSHKSEVLGSWP